MVNRTLIKLSLVGTAILALSVGLGVGLTKRKSNNDKSNSYSNAETTSFGDNAATISSDDCDEVSNADAVVRKRILVLENDEYRLAKAPIRRRALRHNAVQTFPVGWFTDSSMSLSMSFAVANSSKSGKSTKGKHGSSKRKVSLRYDNLHVNPIKEFGLTSDHFLLSIVKSSLFFFTALSNNVEMQDI